MINTDIEKESWNEFKSKSLESIFKEYTEYAAEATQEREFYYFVKDEDSFYLLEVYNTYHDDTLTISFELHEGNQKNNSKLNCIGMCGVVMRTLPSCTPQMVIDKIKELENKFYKKEGKK